MTKKERYKYIFNWFKTNMPVVSTELIHENPYELLVAVILSAQCTDKRVNLTTPEFFKKFPSVESLSKAKIEHIFPLIKSISYPNSKAKYLSGMAKMLMIDFKGVIPDSVKELQKLPGVGRKTANVMASIVYGKPTMAVDTHVFRVSKRLGLTTNAKTPIETEKQLVKNISKKIIPNAHNWLILHGRYICIARKPKCNDCGLTKFCKYFEAK